MRLARVATNRRISAEACRLVLVTRQSGGGKDLEDLAMLMWCRASEGLAIICFGVGPTSPPLPFQSGFHIVLAMPSTWYAAVIRQRLANSEFTRLKVRLLTLLEIVWLIHLSVFTPVVHGACSRKMVECD